MNQSNDARMLHLLQISIDLRDQMAEVRNLRNTLRLAENERRGKKPTDAGGVKDNELRA
jgi:hypothetical protein